MRNGLSALVLASILAWGLYEIVVMPFETGDVYPPYSSLRTDPLGSKALYESLAALPGITVERLYKPRETFQNTAAALFVLGVDPASWASIEDPTLDEYEKLTSNGGRLVIAFVAMRAHALSPDINQSRLAARWHLKLIGRRDQDVEQSRDPIPRETDLYFDAGPEWDVLSRRDDGATVVQRTLGGGSVVLVADSYFLSNQGLGDVRNTELISKLVGPARHIVFDENHFGVVETGSVVKLMLKYRLEGAVVALALAAGLFLWRSGSAFLPPRPALLARAVTGFNSLEGLAALLRRGIATKDLLNTCFSEWRKSAPRDRRAAQVEAAITPIGQRDPVAAYRAARQILSAHGTEKG